MIEDMQKLEIGKIKELIHKKDEHYVIQDADLALLYGYETRRINEAVTRNYEKFDYSSIFKVSDEELLNLMSQGATSKDVLATSSEHGGSRKGHILFTEEGVKILSGILRKPNVQTVTLSILEAFDSVKEKTEESLVIPVSKGENIENLIYEIDGKQVMLDYDLARIYECKNGTKELNQAVKNNKDKFPESYSWILSDEEFQILRSKFLTSNDINRMGNRRYKVRVFTESGTWMLSTILKTEIASKVTMRIIEAFVAMRRYIGNSLIEQKNINNQVLLNAQNILENKRELDNMIKNVNDNKEGIHINTEAIVKNTEAIERLNQVVYKFDEIRNQNAIFFAGQIYDAYSKLNDIMGEAKKELIIVDGYADKQVLDMISKLETKVILFIKTEGNLSDLVIKRYNEQYKNLTVIRTNVIHDRFIILDRQIVYHLGASINHAGRGAFAINRLEDTIIKSTFIDWIEELIENNISESALEM